MLEKIYSTDFMILDWIQEHLRCGWLDWLMPKITFLGEAGWIWIVFALLFLWWKTHRKCGLKMAVSLLICLILGQFILKSIFARPRPCWINTELEMLVKVPKDYSFPSGHTMSSISSAFIILKDDRRIGIPACILAVMIAFSRLYLYVHFPSDVLTGAVLGILFAIATDRIIEKYLSKMPARLISFINAEDLPQGTAEDLPQGTAEDLPQGTAEDLPQGTAEESASESERKSETAGEEVQASEKQQDISKETRQKSSG